MSDSHSPSLLQVIQRPQFWIPGSAALLTLLFLGNRVLNPIANFSETPENGGVASDRASQELTADQAVTGSDIDNLDALLKDLDPREGAPPEPPSEEPTLQDLPQGLSNTTLNLPSFTHNAPPIAPGETIDSTPSEPNTPATDPTLEMRPAQLRNFFSTVTDGSAQPTILNPSSPETQAPLTTPQLSSASRLFGSPQTLGLPQSNLSTLNLSPINLTPPLSPTTIGTNPPLTPPSASSSVPLSPAAPSVLPPVPAGLTPIGSPALNSPTANLGLPSSSSNAAGNNFSTNNFSNNVLIPSPYSLDRSFTDPLAPPIQAPGQPAPNLAPGQYIGNGEINTFANP